MNALYQQMAKLAVRRPFLVPQMLASAWSFRTRHWYRRPPFLPLPSSAYLRWRMDTAYGDPGAVPSFEELERFLRWATAMRGRG